VEQKSGERRSGFENQETQANQKLVLSKAEWIKEQKAKLQCKNQRVPCSAFSGPCQDEEKEFEKTKPAFGWKS
jgi:hypothetical protein